MKCLFLNEKEFSAKKEKKNEMNIINSSSKFRYDF